MGTYARAEGDEAKPFFCVVKSVLDGEGIHCRLRDLICWGREVLARRS